MLTSPEIVITTFKNKKNNQTLIWKSYISSFAKRGTWTLLSNNISRIVPFRANCHSKYHIATSSFSLSMKMKVDHATIKVTASWGLVLIWGSPPFLFALYLVEKVWTGPLCLLWKSGDSQQPSGLMSIQLSSTDLIYQNMFTLRVRATNVNLENQVYKSIMTQTCKEQHYS